MTNNRKFTVFTADGPWQSPMRWWGDFRTWSQVWKAVDDRACRVFRDGMVVWDNT